MQLALSRRFAIGPIFTAGLLIAWAGAARGESLQGDLSAQGEYQGSLAIDGRGDVRCGVQLVAEGRQAFTAVLFVGGLPGAGWEPSTKRQQAAGKTNGDRIEFHSDRWNAVLADGSLTLTAADGSPMGILSKIERESSTLGKLPPSGAVVLFDGSTAEKWIGGRLLKDHTLAAGTVSKMNIRDCLLHLEFYLPFFPSARGQNRANSGVYLQNRYEVQVLDSFGLEPASNDCGALYNLRAPDVNMCFPPERWQTYDIDFTAARFDADQNKTRSARLTARQNGVVIHDDVEIAGPTGGGIADEYPGEGPLQLQWHLAAIKYRNIWLVERNSSAEK